MAQIAGHDARDRHAPRLTIRRRLIDLVALFTVVVATSVLRFRDTVRHPPPTSQTGLAPTELDLITRVIVGGPMTSSTGFPVLTTSWGVLP